MNAAVSKMVLEANRRDLDELARGRYLDELGVRGHVAFGFYVDGSARPRPAPCATRP